MKDRITEKQLDRAMAQIEALSSVIGPRPPGSEQEHLASEVIAGELGEIGLEPQVQHFRTARSFGPSYLTVFGLALLSGPLHKRARLAGATAGGLAALCGLAESRFSALSPLNLLRRGRSQNVWATIEPASEARQTVCLVSHMDSSRSGLMFHPRVTPHLGNAVAAVSLAVFILALAPLLRRFRAGRLLVGLARALVGAGAALVLEREVRGEDVPGANDNASGVGACLAVASEVESNPLQTTRLVVLVTGSEESGVFGMREFLSAQDTEGWFFINFDGVGADAPLRVLSREGGPLSGLKADAELMAHAAAIAAESPELAAAPLAHGSGLPYDSTLVLARGGRAISIVNQEGAIPNYHWPSDTADKISRPALGRAINFASRLLRELDRHSPGR